jgi:hypothetical protein
VARSPWLREIPFPPCGIGISPAGSRFGCSRPAGSRPHNGSTLDPSLRFGISPAGSRFGSASAHARITAQLDLDSPCELVSQEIPEAEFPRFQGVNECQHPTLERAYRAEPPIPRATKSVSRAENHSRLHRLFRRQQRALLREGPLVLLAAPPRLPVISSASRAANLLPRRLPRLLQLNAQLSPERPGPLTPPSLP